jgi:hypothetical protein
MSRRKMAAVVVIALGVLSLVYGGFSYTKETHNAKFGPMEFQFKEKKTVNIPPWVGAGAIAIGTVLLLTEEKS